MEMKTAKPLENALSVKRSETLPCGTKVVTLDCADYKAYKSLPAALEYDGRAYGRTGWDSDMCRAYYRTDIAFARGLDLLSRRVREQHEQGQI